VADWRWECATDTCDPPSAPVLLIDVSLVLSGVPQTHIDLGRRGSEPGII